MAEGIYMSGLRETADPKRMIAVATAMSAAFLQLL